VRLQFVLALTCLLFTFAILLPGQQGEPPGPAQPIAFDHKLHVTDLKVRCKMCHPNPDPGEMMDMPEVSGCMQCHSAIKPKDAESRKLEAFAREKRDIDWVRVYQIPSYVSFSHRAHLQAGAECQTCHGDAGERSRLWKEKDMSMGTCITCHRAKGASIDCSYCHEPR
jgi:Zn ribbon nucleic-acid-binding protein